MPDLVARTVPRNNYLLITLDSCRFDSFMRAAPRHMTRLGTVERRWSYASWTPRPITICDRTDAAHQSKHVYASDYYKRDFLKFNERFGYKGF